MNNNKKYEQLYKVGTCKECKKRYFLNQDDDEEYWTYGLCESCIEKEMNKNE